MVLGLRLSFAGIMFGEGAGELFSETVNTTD